MKKNLSFAVVAVLAFASLLTMPVEAATSTSNFNVVINLTSSCSVNGSVTDVTFNYTSLQVGAATGTGGGFNVKCTNSLPYTMALDQTSVTDNAVNLAYTLALSGASGTGNGANQAYTVNGSMAGGQGGTCATATCDNSAATNKQRTLTITY